MEKIMIAAEADVADKELCNLLRQRAQSMIPTLRAREAEASEQQNIPAITIKEFEDAGFFKILQPKKYGGYELSPSVYCDVIQILAQGCMSSAWVYGVIAVHNWQLALFHPQAAEDVWAQDNNVRIASSYMPVGKVSAADGGYRLSGKWAFSSGSAHCDWVILGAKLPPANGQGAPEPVHFIVPRSDYQIEENWDVMGLRGTGSNNIVVEDAFVPEYRMLSEMDLFDLKCPGHATFSSPLYKIPFAQLFNRTVSTSSLGALRRAIDEFRDTTREKLATYTGARLAGDPAIQQAIVEAAQTVDEIQLRLDRDVAELDARATQNDWSLERRAELAVSTTRTVTRCLAEIDKLMLFTGSKAIFRGNTIQRAFLDIHCARAHVANNPFPYVRNLGGLYFGMENDCFDM